MKTVLTLGASVVALASAATIAQADMIETIKERGELTCGVHTGLVGFGAPDEAGEWQGLDPDYCRAIATAILGEPKVKWVPLSAQARFTSLQNGEIDVLAQNSTMTLARDASLGLTFPAFNFYDGQGLLIKSDLGVSDSKELDGATVCIQQGTTSEYVIRNHFTDMGISFTPVVIESGTEFFSAFFSGRCDVITSDLSQLAVVRLTSDDPSAYTVLPNILAKSPLGPVVRADDKAFENVVKWTSYALLTAEELGVTQANVEEMKASDSAELQSFLGANPGVGELIGLEDDWIYNVISTVGNYSEIFDRNVGKDSPLGLERGQNALWSDGGLMYSPLF
ncbi:MAG: amino acid ABC transporter substrate-binding protein [Cognatishimia sp.]|uniref:amino acid ABC transporter substrate-binding protein n=1 Tax=Cognatishimia sp. 1_MG-2023 TaxID=3062642 RepID=UPI0026E26E6D|nr:amino acid ABC transporter substrate-binding protein [Cognatishimia sp. 1_MG-2023]MDO6727689.1 amino acid ABC transporter substrate-binding protein [Cognatishimia sp. 1_MG-2023]